MMPHVTTEWKPKAEDVLRLAFEEQCAVGVSRVIDTHPFHRSRGEESDFEEYVKYVKKLMVYQVAEEAMLQKAEFVTEKDAHKCTMNIKTQFIVFTPEEWKQYQRRVVSYLKNMDLLK